MRLQCLLVLALVGVSLGVDTCKDVSDMTADELKEAFQSVLRDVKARVDSIDSDLPNDIPDEDREEQFMKNAEQMKKDNENSEFQQKPNKFSMMTPQEKQSQMGLVVDDKTQARIMKMQKKRAAEVQFMKRAGVKRALPDSVDHCAATGPVENQGTCGSCYSFAASHVMTGRMKVRDGDDARTLRVSEQQAVNCVYDRDGCNGGFYDAVWEMYKKNGASTEAKLPYTGTYQPDADACSDRTGRVEVNFADDAVGYVNAGDVEDMKAAVAEGPVAIAMNVRDDFMQFANGVYTAEADCASSINHGMLVCGYNTDTDGKFYWLVKNSWGADWGEQGYIKVEAGKNICNIESYAMYPKLNKDKKTDTSTLCFNDKKCDSDADCNNIRNACQSGTCSCGIQTMKKKRSLN